jgi:hypothetical protein
MKWVIRLFLLVLVFFAAARAYEDANHVIGRFDVSGADGKWVKVECKTFGSDNCIPDAQNDSDVVFDPEGHLLPAKYAAGKLQEAASEYQTWTFVWGAVSLLSCAVILLSFRKSSKPDAEDGVERLGL